MTRLVQLSGVILDQIFRVPEVPLAGEEAIVKSFAMAPGGGFNAMAAARRWGMEVAFAGTLGLGPFADRVAEGLAAEGITVLRTGRLADMDQGTCIVMVDDAGERTFLAKEGADGVMSGADLAGLEISADDWLLLSGYALGYAASRDALTSFLNTRPDGRLVFDPCPLVAAIPAPALRATMGAAAWISANDTEAAFLTGLTDPAAACEALAQARAGAVVRVGAAGCFVSTGATATPIPAFEVTPIDTNGAGDAHVGAFIAAMAEGREAREAAWLANIAAALSTTEEGPSTAPTKARVLDAGDPQPRNRRLP